jgi:peptide/nickel transport system substrate-binding protein
MVLALAAACSPSSNSGAKPQADESRAQPARTLVFITRAEPRSLSLKDIPAVTALGDGPAKALFNGTLDYVDDQETAHPYLEVDLPKLNTDTWQILPDGRMQTTHRLRPGATWHDGAPLSAEDFAFAWEVYAIPEAGYTSAIPTSEMEDVTATDASTVVIHWKRPFPDADEIGSGFPPLPKHILEDSFRKGDLDTFGKHPYWTTQFVGLGPWKLERWEPGAFIEGSVFEGHALGRAKIDRMRLTFNGDTNAVLASLLSGDSHVTLPFTIFPEQTEVLKQRAWGGTVLDIANSWRRVDAQARPDFVSPRALTDVRVRKAFAHAIDRNALNEAVYLGQAIITDTPIPSAVPYYAELDRTIPHYPYDLRLVEQRMTEAGFTRSADGGYIGPDGERLSVEIKANSTEAYVKEMAIIAAGWRQAGLDTKETVVPVALAQNREVRGSFPSFYVGETGGGEKTFEYYTTRAVGTPQNNWVGSNRAGYSNPEYDRLHETFARTLDRSERNRLAIQLATLLSDQVATISLVFSVDTEAVAPGLVGPAPWGPSSFYTWNAYLWRWQ